MVNRKALCTRTLFQPIGEPVLATNASVGERLAAGFHLPVHVPAFPHPLRRATASKSAWHFPLGKEELLFCLPHLLGSKEKASK